MISILNAIKNIDKSSDNGWVQIDEVAEELGVRGWNRPTDLQQRVKEHWLTRWCCTDTWVGVRVGFFDDEPMYVIEMTSRKADPIIKFMSQDAANRLRRYLADDDTAGLHFVDQEEQINLFYKVDTVEALLDDQGFTKVKDAAGVEELVAIKITKRFKDTTYGHGYTYYVHKIEVQDLAGVLKPWIIPIEELLLKIKITEPTHD